MPELFEEEVSDAEKEEDVDTELVIAVPVADVLEFVADVLGMTIVVDDSDVVVDTALVPDAEVDVEDSGLVPEPVLVVEETLEPPVI